MIYINEVRTFAIFTGNMLPLRCSHICGEKGR